MKFIGNLIWFILAGLGAALSYFTLGLIWCITIIGIPFGKQCFKMAKLMIWPFGKTVVTKFESHPIANVIWMIFGGLELAIGFFFLGLIFCVTVIGIPFGKQCFKMAKLSLTPFGAHIY